MKEGEMTSLSKATQQRVYRAAHRFLDLEERLLVDVRED
jgi:hypothetical protein